MFASVIASPYQVVLPGLGDIGDPHRRAKRHHVPVDQNDPVAALAVDPVTGAPERPDGAGMYLHWEGRRGYRTHMPAPRVLEPVPSLGFGNSRASRLIEGDNLQVMVSLRSQYQGEVDVAYLDPPYNTGKSDFAYSDRRYHDPNADNDDQTYVNNEDGGRHTKWLNYMGPRLWLVWQLLAEHGVCFVSINDVELFRLGLLMDEVFGEKNRIATLVWKGAVDNNPTRVAVEHEYVLCYAKNIDRVAEHWQGVHPAKEWLLNTYQRIAADETDPAVIERLYREAMKVQRAKHRQAVKDGRGDEVIDLGRMDRYRNVDARGPWAKDWHLENPRDGGYDYDILHPVTGKSCRKPPKGYRYPPESMQELLANDLIVFGTDETDAPQLRRYLKDAGDALRGVIQIPSRNGSDTLNALIPGATSRYKNPKPVELVTLLLGAAGDMDSLILDPFAGSGTTGHAVMRLNARDGGVRRFILIEEGNKDDRYCRTLTAPRLKAAIEQESLPGGFEFEEKGRRLNRTAIVELEREAITSLILQTDATGRAQGIRRVEGEHVIGVNPRQEALCLCWQGRASSTITRDVLVAMFDEAKRLGLKRPLRVYGSTCEVGETESFRFCQIPDDILAALQLDEESETPEEDVEVIERLEAAHLVGHDA